MSFIQIKNLVFRYERRRPPVINQFSLQLAKGEIMGMLGKSGSGKSTILRLVAGLDIPEQGEIVINERTIVDAQVCIPPEKREIGMVFQDYALFPHLTVAANITFGLQRWSRAERKKRLKEMLELVQLESFVRRYPHELSGGQQQRVALARALAPQPSLLLMDEPFSNLDTELKGTIRRELRAILRQAKMTCLFVSHDEDDIAAICDDAIRVGTDGEYQQRESS